MQTLNPPSSLWKIRSSWNQRNSTPSLNNFISSPINCVYRPITEKASIQGAAQFKADLEQARIDLEQARRQGDLGRMSEIQYGKIPELEKKIAESGEGEADTSSHQLLRSNVTEEEIAEVVSRWYSRLKNAGRRTR